MSPAHVDARPMTGTRSDWVFDLDNTLYAAESELYDALGAKMTAYVARATGLAHAEAFALQERYFHQYGATIVGMVEHHGVDAHDFLTDVHDVDLSPVPPDPELAELIRALPGRKFVFTNGGGGHAERMIAHLRLDACFDGVFDIMHAQLKPKPQRAAYEQLIATFDIKPNNAVLIEDTLRNLEPAHDLGFATILIGPVHPDPLPPYVDHYTRDLKAFLRAVDRSGANA
jgi:putative hydrolase of the HAD superfamily